MDSKIKCVLEFRQESKHSVSDSLVNSHCCTCFSDNY